MGQREPGAGTVGVQWEQEQEAQDRDVLDMRNKGGAEIKRTLNFWLIL